MKPESPVNLDRIDAIVDFLNKTPVASGMTPAREDMKTLAASLGDEMPSVRTTPDLVRLTRIRDLAVNCGLDIAKALAQESHNPTVLIDLASNCRLSNGGAYVTLDPVVFVVKDRRPGSDGATPIPAGTPFTYTSNPPSAHSTASTRHTLNFNLAGPDSDGKEVAFSTAGWGPGGRYGDSFQTLFRAVPMSNTEQAVSREPKPAAGNHPALRALVEGYGIQDLMGILGVGEFAVTNKLHVVLASYPNVEMGLRASHFQFGTGGPGVTGNLGVLPRDTRLTHESGPITLPPGTVIKIPTMRASDIAEARTPHGFILSFPAEIVSSTPVIGVRSSNEPVQFDGMGAGHNIAMVVIPNQEAWNRPSYFPNRVDARSLVTSYSTVWPAPSLERTTPPHSVMDYFLPPDRSWAER